MRTFVAALSVAVGVAGALVAAPPATATSAIAIEGDGYARSCAITDAGGAVCWGNNQKGQLGDGTVTARNLPTPVSGLSSGVIALAAGGFHTCALTSGGAVKCWGANESGQLGNGTTDEHHTPVAVTGLSSGVVAITAGGQHTCALTSGGGMKCWGSNSGGRLGDGTTTNITLPDDVSGLTSGVASISANGWYSCAVTTGGGAKCWGLNEAGELGDGTTTERHLPTDVSGLTSGVALVSASTSHACAVTTGGAVKCWGYNASGQVGDGTYEERHAPVAVSGMSSGIEDVSAGVEHTCALTTGGAVKCWGNNGSGELGVGIDPITSPTPLSVTGLDSGVSAISAGYSHTLALLDDGSVWAWGNGLEGQLGNGSNPFNAFTPQRVSGFFPGVGQADGLISRGAGFIGGNIYNTTTANQTIGVTRAAGRIATFTVRIQNDGDATDEILVDGTPAATGFTMLVTRNGTNVTNAFLAGTLSVTLDPGTRQDLVVRITVKATTRSGKVDRETVLLTSMNDLAGKDAVRAKVTVR